MTKKGPVLKGKKRGRKKYVVISKGSQVYHVRGPSRSAWANCGEFLWQFGAQADNAKQLRGHRMCKKCREALK